jgi:hypothetical protein
MGHPTVQEFLAGTIKRVAAFGPQPRNLPEHPPQLFGRVQRALDSLRPDAVLSGLGPGYPMVAARAALGLKIPLIAVLPCRDYSDTWNHADSIYKEFIDLLAHAEYIHVVHDDDYRAVGKLCYTTRDRWLVDYATELLIHWEPNDAKHAWAMGYNRGLGAKARPLTNTYRKVRV